MPGDSGDTGERSLARSGAGEPRDRVAARDLDPESNNQDELARALARVAELQAREAAKKQAKKQTTWEHMNRLYQDLQDEWKTRSREYTGGE